ncbi:MAG: hypothetical protein C0424_11690 [Sphingobacteriaceae bacterium]|nr:hypothetical protein [Sphingobacteriaceae bacterium]
MAQIRIRRMRLNLLQTTEKGGMGHWAPFLRRCRFLQISYKVHGGSNVWGRNREGTTAKHRCGNPFFRELGDAGTTMRERYR